MEGTFDTVNTAFWDGEAGCYRCFTRYFVNLEEGMAEADVGIYSGFEGSVQEAVDAWLDGGLEPLRAPDGKSRH